MRDKRWAGAAVLIFGALALAPLALDSFGVDSARDIVLFALFAVGLNFFWGQSGILSFGHATFFGLGAYGMAITSVSLDIPYGMSSVAGLVLGVVAASLVAFLLAYFLIAGQVRGAYFTVITLATSVVAQQLAIGWPSVTGGDSGLVGVPPLHIGQFELGGSMSQFYFAWLLLLVAVVILRVVLYGERGRALKALQDNEIKLQTLGFSTNAYLISLFVCSAAISGLAGAVYAANSGFVAPDMIGIVLSTEVIMWVVVGGKGSSLGPIVGTVVLWQVQERVSSMNASLWPLFMGGFFIVLVLLFPDGLASLVKPLGEKIAGGKAGVRPS